MLEPSPTGPGESPRSLAASQKGWGTAALLAPHVLLGTWLMVVPDHATFRTNQVVLLLHVALALASVPVVAWFVYRHARGMNRSLQGGRARVESWVLAAVVLFAGVSGGLVLQSGSIAPEHALHRWVGLALGLVFARHLWNGRRRVASARVLAVLGVGAGLAVAARYTIPPEVADAPPAFAFETVPVDRYDSATTCGGCHAQQYAEWSRSTHGRTMENPIFLEGMDRQPYALNHDLRSYGQIVAGGHDPHERDAVGSCERCHTPTSFYGDDPADPRRAGGTAHEGITCSFCHTVRAIHPGLARDQPMPSTVAFRTDWPHILPRLPYYVSAPGSVHRYLGEASGTPLGRWIANRMIRWRPAVHRHDLHAPVLDSPDFCMPCHSQGDFDQLREMSQKPYHAWEHSAYNTKDPATTVRCQDCHMARTLTGKRQDEPGRLVPWGPVRPRSASHLFLGGNVTVATLLRDFVHAQSEHDLNVGAVTFAVLASRVAAGAAEVDVQVGARNVGHDLPSVSAQNRWLWVELSALDGAGRNIATTRRPEKGDDQNSDAPILFRCTEPPRPGCDSVITADGTRTLQARLRLPPDAKPAKLIATLFLSTDPEPLACATIALDAPR